MLVSGGGLVLLVTKLSEDPRRSSFVAGSSFTSTAITEFFVKYNELQGKKFRSPGIKGPGRALEIVKRGIKAAEHWNLRKQ
jgi:hypothetical protein